MQLKATYTINIFIAYHSNDKDKLDELRIHLRDLNVNNEGYIINKVWIDSVDVDWETTQELIAGADLILLLMSNESIMSPLFISEPIRKTLEQHEIGRSLVVPIIMNTCWWEDTIFKNLDVLPRAGLPIYDSADVKNQLFDQVIEGLDYKLLKIQEQKKELEALFKLKIKQADAIFSKWEKKPETLRTALPLFRKALEYWREGFLPDKKQIESSIDICLREIDFHHYAKAAHDAYKVGDIQTCYFNCKDALGLRDDAVMRKLFQEISDKLAADKLSETKRPFDTLLKRAQTHFLALEWQKAEQFFELALEKHQEEFIPSTKVIKHKIQICKREFILENSLAEAERLYSIQNYQRMANVLMAGIQEINHDAFYKIEYALKLIGYLDNVEAYRDNKLDKWGFKDVDSGNIIIAPKYTAAYNFTENLAGVKKWDKWGFIDVEGNEIIPFKYDYVSSFQNGIAQVILKDKTWCINHKGKTIDADIIIKEIPINETIDEKDILL